MNIARRLDDGAGFWADASFVLRNVADLVLVGFGFGAVIALICAILGLALFALSTAAQWLFVILN